MNNLTNFIRIVLSQSKLAMEKDEIPIASVIVDPIDERVIARSFNQEIASNDPTAHAEILCIRKACKKLNQKRLDGLIMISYLEPCHMCKEVIKSSRLSEVYYLFKNENPSRKTISKVKYKLIKNNEENLIKKFFKTSDQEINEGETITIDGSTGRIILGTVPTIKPEISGDFSKLMSWADKIRKLKVRTNSETPLDTKTARDFGAEGIGLCRTEHMFFDEERILSVREMILSKTLDDRSNALKKILPHQKKDFMEIFKIMHGLPVTVRLLDPPLHEFLPKSDKEISEVANVIGSDKKEIERRIEELHEQNPMLGHRGCRLGISFPEIYEMQCRAIFEALADLKKSKQKFAFPEIMIPLVSTETEIKIMKDLVINTARKVQKENKTKIEFLVGTMIELPRAAIKADDIAKHAEFFSFGTNDLTQTTFGISRDDSGKFLNDYIDNKIFTIDPFVSIDDGVKDLVEIAVSKGKKQNKKIKLGICGEHGGDPKSIKFCSKAGLNYVSCSPYRVPIARLAAAQAELTKNKN